MVPVHQSTPWYRWLRWGDYLIYILISMAAVVLFFQGPAFMRPVVGGVARINVDGQDVRTIEAADLAKSGQFELEANGFHYKIEYANGQVRIKTADCPDQVCVQTGWVSRLGQVAACVPGHLILSVDNATSPDGAQTGETTAAVDVILR